LSRSVEPTTKGAKMKDKLRSVVLLLLLTSTLTEAAAGDCSNVNCDAVKSICFGLLDLDPVTCGIYYGCCYNKSELPVGDNDCRGNPCGPGCPSDLCIQSGVLQEGLTVGPAQIKTDVAPAACASGLLSVMVAKGTDGTVSYNWWNMGQGARGWQTL